MESHEVRFARVDSAAAEGWSPHAAERHSDRSRHLALALRELRFHKPLLYPLSYGGSGGG